MNKSRIIPDEQWRWIVIISTFCTCFILGGINRSAGILLVAFINEFELSRKEASLPFTVWFAMIDYTGIIVGVLAHRYDIRSMTVVGSVLGATGLSVCYFTSDMNVITFCFAVFGCGFSFSYTLLAVIVNQYFPNNKAVMNGIVFSGSCFGSFVFPPLFEYLIFTYGLKGCLLLTGGIILQICVFGALMRPPLAKSQRYSETLNEHTSEPPVNDSKNLEEHIDEPDIVIAKQVEENSVTGNNKVILQDVRTMSSHGYDERKQFNKIINNIISCDTDIQSEVPPELILKCDALCGGEFETHANKPAERAESETSSKLIFPVDSTVKESNCSTDSLYCKKPSDILIGEKLPSRDRQESPQRLDMVNCEKIQKPLGVFKTLKCLLSCPMFYVYAITCTIFYFNYQIFLIINVDYFLDRGVVSSNTKYIYFSLSGADLLGRLTLGCITDRNILRRSHFLMLTMAVMTALFLSFPFAHGFMPLNSLSSLYGITLGSSLVVFNVILLDYISMEMQEIAFGLFNLLNGNATLLIVFLIGHFRDNLKSYSSIFFIMGLTSLIASLLWLFECCFVRMKSKDKVKRMS